MHLYIATKGIKHEIDQFITQLQGKYLPYKFRVNETDPFVDAQVQLSVRPIQLWEIGYPKECHDIVCSTILGKDDGSSKVLGNDGNKPTEHKWAKKFIYMFRKLLHLKPVPPYNSDVMMPIRKQHMMVVPLGCKDDYTMANGVEGI